MSFHFNDEGLWRFKEKNGEILVLIQKIQLIIEIKLQRDEIIFLWNRRKFCRGDKVEMKLIKI